MSNIFSFSVGRKLIMSLMGLFLVTFLVVHLGINLLIIFDNPECGVIPYEAFNKAAHFMGSNVLIKIMEIGLFGGFLLHMIYGMVLSVQNKMARPVGYAKSNNSQTSFFSKYMFHTAVVVGIFLILHLFDFYLKAKIFHGVETLAHPDYPEGLHDLGSLVVNKFQIIWVVVFYIVALLGLGFHLHHGFQSAFQTIGVNHKVYTPVIKALGVIYSLVVTLGFIAIPVYVYVTEVILK